MYRNTRFGELLKGLPRHVFANVVATHDADKHNKGFDCWQHLVAMIFAQVNGCHSLREVEAGFNSHDSAHYHLGSREIKRSTLADANARRSADVFATLCNYLVSQAHRGVRKELKDLLYLLDSTPIPLKGLGYDWAQEKHNHRTHGLKLHLLYAPTRGLPVHSEMSAANVNDIDVGREIPVETGATYVFDKGYTDYNWWFSLHQRGARFVTRFKKDAGVHVISPLDLPGEEEAAEILEDVIVAFKYRRPGGKRINHYHGTPLRRITVARPDKDTPLVLATNDLDRPATEIAELYKQRWGIELFFKWLKQNLKIKRFLGRSENAVRIQIYTALITYLLAYLYARRHGVQHSLKMWLIELRSGLFQRPESEQISARKRRRERQWLDEIQGALAL